MARQTDLLIGDIPVRVRYGNVKHIRVTVRPPDGEVRVSAPNRANEQHVIDFLEARREWLRSNRARLTRPVEDGVRVWGELVPLDVTIRPGAARVEQADGRVLALVPTQDALPGALISWRKQLLAAAIPPLVATWEPRLGVKAKALTYRHMTSRWGTCNRRTGRLTFNTDLSLKHPGYTEYVVVHELAHLEVPNHGPEFQAILNQHLPQWRATRRALNAH